MKVIPSRDAVQLKKKKAIISYTDVQIMRRLMRFSGWAKEILHMSYLCYLQISLAGQTHFFLLALKNTILPLFFSETLIPPTVGRAFCTPSSFSFFLMKASFFLTFLSIKPFPMLCRCAVASEKKPILNARVLISRQRLQQR